MPAGLDQTVRSLMAAHARALGSLDAATGALAASLAAGARDLDEALQARITDARNRATQRAADHIHVLRRLNARLAVKAEGPLAAADHVTVGRLSLPVAAAPVEAPCVIPLVGRGNLVVEAPQPQGAAVVRHVVWQALKGTAPGQLDIVGFDPLLSGTLAPFSGLRSASGSALTILSRQAEIGAALERLVADVQRVNELLRGVSGTLLDFRDRTGHPVERFQLVVLLDHPEAVDETAYHQLLSLAKAGPAAGISFLWQVDPAAEKPSWWKRADLEACAELVLERSRRYRWAGFPQFELDVPVPEPAELVVHVDALVSRAGSASAPEVPFAAVQPTDGRWSESSAAGVTFAIGTAGGRPVEVTLGDDREQRHNLLVTGAVGQGKSNLLKVVIHSLCQRYPPRELELYLLDFKEGVTLYPFAATPGSGDYLPHARVLGLESDREFGLAVLRHLEAEFTRRARLFRPYGDHIAAYRAAVPDAAMPRILLVVDEFHLLFDPVDKNAEEAAGLLEALARRGRAYGLHIILASQTVSGIAALMTRENGIFAQFPVRLALRNALTESHATLSQGNDAAARLRARGEAVLNLDYGAPDANRHVVIAAAGSDDLHRLRLGWWEQARRTVPPPLVFDGARLIRPSAGSDAMKALRRRVRAERVAPSALVGFPIDVSGSPLAVSFGSEPGRNLAVLGAGEKAGRLEIGADAANNAIGVLQAAAVSLALQHPDGDAAFVSFELMDDVSARRNHHDDWLAVMERLGFPVRRVAKADTASFLRALAGDLPARDTSSRLYLLAFGMDRAGNLEVPDAFAHRPVDDLQALLRDGPGRSVHVLGWWSNAATFKAHVGYGGDGYVEALVMLRLDQTAVQDLLGPFVTWSVRDNRGLVADRTQLPEPTAVVPFAPLDSRDAAVLTAIDWDA